MNLEMEKTYKISEKQRKRIIKLLDNCNSKKIVVLSKGNTETLHIQIESENENIKKRIKIKYKNTDKLALKIKYAPKIRISKVEEDYQIYIEDSVPVLRTNENYFFPMCVYIKAMYFKERYKYICRYKNTKYIIAIDRVDVIDPMNANYIRNKYYYLEVEGNSNEEIDALLKMLFEYEVRSIYPLKINESKIEVAYLKNREVYIQFPSLHSLEKFAWEIYKKRAMIFHVDEEEK